MSNVITFCKQKCCPVVEVQENTIILGDAKGPEGITTWTKNQFKDFIEKFRVKNKTPKLLHWANAEKTFMKHANERHGGFLTEWMKNIELIDENFYACFEEAVNEYGAQINQFNIRNNLLNLQGMNINENPNISGMNIKGSGLPHIINITKDYGSYVGVGGNVEIKKKGIDLIASNLGAKNTLTNPSISFGSKVVLVFCI